ncbi:anoctamin-8-like, partial [Parus major]|uniref:anoctamin-8-like n=1 Tax=Parus major TaxID=9157 RepID=UPI0007713E66
MSHKAWMKTVPTENCDVLMTFPDSTDDHTLLWLLNHIRLGIPELIVQVRHHKHTRVYAFFVTATYERCVLCPQGPQGPPCHRGVPRV